MKFLVFILFLLAPISTYAQGPVVLELFTTQSCSSCPPADELFEQLVTQEQDLIAVSCHVGAMNNAGWVDTLSQDFCDERQAAYMHALGARGMYTPFLVMNGRFDMRGGDEKTVRSGMAMVRSLPSPTEIDVRISDGRLEFTLPDMDVGEVPAQVSLYGLRDFERVKITSGQNEGRHMAYLNAANFFVSLMKWDGDSDVYAFPLEDQRADSYVVLVQNARSDNRDVIAVGQVRRLPSSEPKDVLVE